MHGLLISKKKKKKKDMEISEDKFFLFWSAITVIFLKLGLGTIDDDTELSNSIPPLAMFLIKHSIAIFTCYSSIHAFFIRQQTNKSVNIYLLNFTNGIFILLSFLGGGCGYCFVPIYTVTTLYNLYLIVYDRGDFVSEPNYKLQLAEYAGYNTVSTTIFVSLSAFGPASSESRGYLIYIAFYLYAPCLYQFEHKRWGKSVPPDHQVVHDQNMDLLIGTNKVKRSIEFAVGLLGTIVSQSFFRFKSFKQVVGFLYLAVAWLADLTLLSPSNDLGVLNFLLGNTIAGCVVSELGVSRKTWIACAASCVFLYCLRLKIQSLSLVNRGVGNCKVILW